MNKPVKYLKIEKKIFTSPLGKIGYIVIFVLLGAIFMSILDFILYGFIDNFYLSKFIFNGEMSFSRWFSLIYSQYSYSYLKILFFCIIFLFIAIYRSKTLTKIFSK